MALSRRLWLIAGISVGACFSLWSFAWSQGSGSTRTSPPPASPRPAPPPEEFHLRLWRFMVREQSPYTTWPSLPGKTGSREAKSPHGPVVRLHTYKVDAEKADQFPSGCVLVLENYTADKKSRTSIDVMYRYTAYNPASGDWYWMKYYESGTVATAPPAEGGMPIAGRVKSCIECHANAQGQDFVFSNDPFPAAGNAAEAVAPQPAPPEPDKVKPE